MNDTEHETKVKVDTKASAELFKQLAELLEDNDSDALDCVAELRKVSGCKELNEISQMISEYDFDEALILLKKST